MRRRCPLSKRMCWGYEMARDEKRIFIIQKNHLHFHALYVHKCAYLEQMFVVKCSNCNFRRKFNVYLKLIYMVYVVPAALCCVCIFLSTFDSQGLRAERS